MCRLGSKCSTLHCRLEITPVVVVAGIGDPNVGEGEEDHSWT